jgi:hypothetical protein
MDQTLRRLQFSQLDVSGIFANSADISVTLLVQIAAVLDGFSDKLFVNDDLATGLLERLTLAGDSVVWVL